MKKQKRPIFISPELRAQIDEAHARLRDIAVAVSPSYSDTVSYLLKNGLRQHMVDPAIVPPARINGRKRSGSDGVSSPVREDPYLTLDLIAEMEETRRAVNADAPISRWYEIVLWNGIKFHGLNPSGSARF